MYFQANDGLEGGRGGCRHASLRAPDELYQFAAARPEAGALVTEL
jgi:hypothetical protein